MNPPPISSADSFAITATQNSPATPANEIQRADEERPPQPAPDVKVDINSGNVAQRETENNTRIENEAQAREVASNVVNLIQRDPELASSAQSGGLNNALAEAALKNAS